MTIEIRRPELEALIQARLSSGVFLDIDELLTQALGALNEKQPLHSAQLPQNADQEYVELEPEEWVRKFQAWSQRHAHDDLPILSDEAISRESIYEDRGL